MKLHLKALQRIAQKVRNLMTLHYREAYHCTFLLGENATLLPHCYNNCNH